MTNKIEGSFEVQSLQSIGTENTDADMGVVRVSASLLRQIGKRNDLVRITYLEEKGQAGKSIIRIVRAATGKNALRDDQVAIQYDDRVELGVKSAGSIHRLRIEQVDDWWGLPRFLLGHTSPLVRKEALFAVAMMVVGVVLGAVAGFAVGLAF